MEQEKGSVTLYVTLSCIILVTVLSLTVFNITNRNNNQKKQLEKIADNYSVSDEDMEQAYEEAGGTQVTVERLQPGDTAKLTQKNNYVDGDKKATIPEGFKVSDTDNTIDTGLVVIAPDGSEFVWVPVENAIAKDEKDGNTKKAMAVKQSDGSYRGLLYNFTDTSSSVISGCTTTNFTSNSGFREPVVLKYNDDSTNIDDSAKGITLKMLQLEYEAMIESVEKYGGFYVGRYETSYDGNNVASKGKQTPMSAGTTSGNMWYGMYDKQKNYTKNVNGKDISTIVGSSMIWGSQYDAMLNWILKGNDKSKVTTNSTAHNLTTTGSTSDDVMNKIYDLGNNLCEWTLVAVNSVGRSPRGGYYGYTYPPSFINSAYPNVAYNNVGSRLALYIR